MENISLSSITRLLNFTVHFVFPFFVFFRLLNDYKQRFCLSLFAGRYRKVSIDNDHGQKFINV